MLLNSRRYRDARLVQRTLSGNREAYAELVHGYLGAATAFAFSRVHSRADAEDVAQESFIRAFERLDSLRDPAKFGPWLFGIVRNCAGRMRQRERAAVALDESHLQTNAVQPDFAREEMFAELRRLVDGLAETQREIVVLHYYSRKRTREIAALLEMTPAAVRKQLERARKQLGKQMLEQASGKFEWTSDHTKKTIAIVAATSAAWIGSRSAVAAALTGVYKIAATISLIVAGAAVIFARVVESRYR